MNDDINRFAKDCSHTNRMKTYKDEYDECLDDVLFLIDKRISNVKKEYERIVAINEWKRENNIKTSNYEGHLDFLLMGLVALRQEVQNMREENDLQREG